MDPVDRGRVDTWLPPPGTDYRLGGTSGEWGMGVLRRWRIMAILVCLLTLLAARHVVAQPTVKGDRAAYEKVGKAFESLRTVKSYRMRSVSPRISSSVIITEFANPDRRRNLDRRTDFAIETIWVGNETRLRVIRNGRPEPWSCPKVPRLPSDTRVDSTVEVEVIDLGTFRIGGVMTRGYQYATTIPRGTAIKRVYLDIDTGLIRRQEIPGSDGKLLTMIDYYDYNAPIKITLPECGSVTPPPQNIAARGEESDGSDAFRKSSYLDRKSTS